MLKGRTSHAIVNNMKDHFEHLLTLLALEEAEEIEQFKKEFVQKTPEEREKSGKALLRLIVSEFHYSPGGHRLVSFRYESGKPLPVYSPDVGDMVHVCRDWNAFFDLPAGIVYEKNKEVITVALHREPPAWLNEDGIYHLNLSNPRATFQKMAEALKEIQAAQHNRLAYFRDLSLGLKKPQQKDPVPIESTSFFNCRLNRSQKEAVCKALEAEDIMLIQGPPGTGKTTVLIEIIRQVISRGQLVFATAPSNIACDNLLEGLVSAGLSVLRLGHPARIMNHLRKFTLDFQLSHHPYSKMVDELEAELHHAYRRRERRQERGGISRNERIQMADEIRNLKWEIRTLESNILEQVLKTPSVFVGTPASAGDPLLKGKQFDLVVMDEATQAIEPTAWLALRSTQKMVFAGDHFQLPPTVLSPKALEGGLGRTLFERCHDLLEEEFKALLNVQYRMHEKIMNFSSGRFYGGKLMADPSVKEHTLADLPNAVAAPETRQPLLFLDTAGRGFEESLEPGSQSRYNIQEAELVLEELNKLLKSGVLPEQIAVVSPYSAQVRWLADRIPEPKIEIASVDSFQGREKEAVLLSLVRSNVEGELGFLTDTRRMNVAMTRAKRKLIVIGDSATLAHIPFYRDFLQYAESIGGYRSSWEDRV